MSSRERCSYHATVPVDGASLSCEIASEAIKNLALGGLRQRGIESKD
jgi:hypothetical protein